MTAREEERHKGSAKPAENNKMKLATSYLSIITLNINGLNFVIKGHRVAERMKK
jgi:hypothetical protein